DGRQDVQLRFHETNRGRGATVQEGMKLARGDMVGFLDIDLEISAWYIPAALDLLRRGQADMVIAHRVYKLRPHPVVLLRHLLSIGYRMLARWMIDAPVQDSEAGFKFFRRQAVLPVLDRCQDTGWFWDTEITYLSHLAGLKIVELPCLFLRRVDKTSTVRVLRDTLAYFRSLRAFKERLRREQGHASSPADLRQRDDMGAYWHQKPETFARFYENDRSLGGRIVGRFLRQRSNILLQMLGEHRFDEMLDIGCGSGVHLALLHECTGRASGMDYSFNMLRKASDMKQQLQADWLLVQGDAQAVPFASERFDLVISMGVLDYVPDPVLALKEMKRILRDDGLLVFTFPKRPSPVSLLRTPIGLPIRQHVLHLPPIAHAYTRDELLAHLSALGLRVEHMNSLWTCMWIVSCRKVGEPAA
ncbi:MAG: methyltransferase domain-containing protein, partial [Zetaproteobacteria bacterium]